MNTIEEESGWLTSEASSLFSNRESAGCLIIFYHFPNLERQVLPQKERPPGLCTHLG